MTEKNEPLWVTQYQLDVTTHAVLSTSGKYWYLMKSGVPLGTGRYPSKEAAAEAYYKRWAADTE